MKTKRAARKITVDVAEFFAVFRLKRIGIGVKEIMRRTGLSQSQITYRAHMAKVALGTMNGLSVEWRNGNHPQLKSIMANLEAVEQKSFEQNVLTHFIVLPPRE